ncbi:MAG: maleylpyruvate isomerase family mycothiol-dependent enzyme [Propionibacteriaceae bacterium]|nr:maleylpyruvate isomerase family mycothiol-dependent enzyme [Propionibacteriaceae bacterium]
MDHLQLIEAETDRFIAVLREVDPQAPVPTCPEWTASELLWHLTDVHAFWARILASGALTDDESEQVEEEKPTRPDDSEAVVASLETETAALVAELAAREDAEPAWSWFATDQTVGFTRRMQVHEATMHRVDAEATASVESAPIAPEVAVDGIAHAIDVMLAWWGTNPGFEFHPCAGAVELRLSDAETRLVVGGRWRGTGQSGKSYDEPGVAFTADVEPVAMISGTAEEVYRWLWGRGPEPATSGDQEALDAVRAAQAQGMQ